MDVLALLLWVLDCDIEHLGEVLAEAVTCGALDTSAVGGDISLDSGSVFVC